MGDVETADEVEEGSEVKEVLVARYAEHVRDEAIYCAERITRNVKCLLREELEVGEMLQRWVTELVISKCLSVVIGESCAYFQQFCVLKKRRQVYLYEVAGKQMIG